MSKLLNNAVFGRNIRKIRDSRGLTQEQTVARMQLLGSPLSRSAYAGIELGKGNIFVSDLVALQKIFNVDFSEFFDGVTTER
ncbi:MAG: helix-turn-helix transcriptional regulator [Clostridia bacterium]|nr:helix-turn-helix transcriptional regulator [Clostridia bacterium]